MTTTESYFDDPDRRARLLADAAGWLGTPFAHRAAVRGAGVDCVHLCAELMVAAGVVASYSFPRYSLDRAQHREESLVLAWLADSPRFARVDAAEPPRTGDLALFTFGRCVHHCAVVLEPPRVIQALQGATVSLGQLDDSTLARRLWGFFRPLPL